MNSELALCYYPTQVALIDDNAPFLTALSLHMQQNFRCCAFEDPLAGLNYLNHSARAAASPLFNDELKALSHGDFDDIVQLTFNQPSFLRERKARYEELSVVVVDYQMPGINGLEFCRRLRDTNLKKILLTSEISSGDVIDAFNEGLIDYYICKGKRNMTDELKQAISRLQHDYFRDISRQLKTRALEGENTIFSDPILSKHVVNTCKELDVREYYFITKPSRYILHTRAEKEYALLIFSENEIEKHLRIMQEENAPEDLIRKIRSRHYIPFFSSNDGFYEPETALGGSYLLQAKKVSGKQNYYCAIHSASQHNPNSLAVETLVATYH